MKKLKIIAEAGCNHNGNLRSAYKLVDQAVAAKADIIKFQIYDADQLVTKNAENTRTALELRLPICVDTGERVSLSRRIGSRWRLIGYGIIQ